MLKECMTKYEGLICASVCTSAEPSRHAIHAQACVDLVGQGLPALSDLCLNRWGLVEDDSGAISRGGRYSRDRKCLAICQDGFSIPIYLEYVYDGLTVRYSLVAFQFLKRIYEFLDEGGRVGLACQ